LEAFVLALAELEAAGLVEEDCEESICAATASAVKRLLPKDGAAVGGVVAVVAGLVDFAAGGKAEIDAGM
jgi:hypothetical protein